MGFIITYVDILYVDADATRVVIDDLELMMSKKVGKNGQVYIGKSYAGKEIELIIASVKNTDSNQSHNQESACVTGEK